MKTGLIWKEWRQNVWVFVAFIILVIGYGQIEVHQTIESHNTLQKHYQSEEFALSQKSKDEDLYVDETEIEDSLKVYADMHVPATVFSMILVLFMGLKITVFEKNKRADYIAQAMPYSKLTIIMHKLLLPLVIIIGACLLYSVTTYLTFTANVDAHYLFTLNEWLISNLNALLLLLLIFSFSFMMGTLIGDVVVAVAATGALLLSAMVITVGTLRYNIIGFYAYFKNSTIESISNSDDLSFLFDRAPYANYIILIILVVVFLILGCLFYSKASLENNGLMLMLPKARMPILIIGSLYTALILTTLNIDNDNRVSDAMVKSYLLHFGLTALIAFAIGWVLFYKVKKLRRI